MKPLRLFTGAMLVALFATFAFAPIAGAASKNVKIKIVLLAAKAGEDTSAVDDFANSAELAVEELGPKKVEFIRIPAPLSPAAAQTALLQALDQKPDLIIGLPSSTQTEALSATIAQSGVPFIAASGSIVSTFGQPNGAANLYLMRPLNTDSAVAGVRYFTKEDKAKEFGLVCVQAGFGTSSCNAAKAEIAATGGTVFAERQNSAVASDLTSVALGMQGADVVLDYNFPNPLGVLANQLVQNGIDVPHFGAASASSAVKAGAVTGDALANLYGLNDCVPTLDKKGTPGRTFADKYEAKYGSEPVDFGTETYDMVNFAYAAAQKAGSVAPAKLLKAMQSLSYTGACGDYKADEGHVMLHTVHIVSWKPDATLVDRSEVKIPPIGAKGSSVVDSTTTTAAPTTTTAAPR